MYDFFTMRPDERGDLGIGDATTRTERAVWSDVHRHRFGREDTEEGPARIRNHHTSALPRLVCRVARYAHTGNLGALSKDPPTPHGVIADGMEVGRLCSSLDSEETAYRHTPSPVASTGLTSHPDS